MYQDSLLLTKRIFSSLPPFEDPQDSKGISLSKSDIETPTSDILIKKKKILGIFPLHTLVLT